MKYKSKTEKYKKEQCRVKQEWKQVRKLNWIAEPELWLLFNVHPPNQTKFNSSSKPNKNQPHQTKPNSTTPNQTHPYQTELNYTKPNSSIPNRTHPHQTKLIHTKPISTAPNQTHLHQTKPSQTIPNQIWPSQTGRLSKAQPFPAFAYLLLYYHFTKLWLS